MHTEYLEYAKEIGMANEQLLPLYVHVGHTSLSSKARVRCRAQLWGYVCHVSLNRQLCEIGSYAK